MYNQWTLQQIATMQLQFAALQQQQQHYFVPQMIAPNVAATPPPPPPMLSPVTHIFPEDVNKNNSNSDDEDDEHKRTLFCANLDERVTEELLYEVFLQAGPVESVRIPKDNGGRQRTFGFVTFVHACSVPYTLRLFQGLTLFRKPLTIKLQQQPQQQQQHHRSITGDARANYNNSNAVRSDQDLIDINAATANPFKRDDLSDWTLEGAAAMARLSSKRGSAKSRPHQTALPYTRREKDSAAAEVSRSHEPHVVNDFQRRHQQQSGGSNRRSEQRNNNNNNNNQNKKR